MEGTGPRLIVTRMGWNRVFFTASVEEPRSSVYDLDAWLGDSSPEVKLTRPRPCAKVGRAFFLRASDRAPAIPDGHEIRHHCGNVMAFYVL